VIAKLSKPFLALVLGFTSVGVASAGSLPTEAEMATHLENIDVHENELIPGEYEAPEFAADFQSACTDLGFHCMQLFFGTHSRTQHVANVIEVHYEWSTLMRKFCLVEPQIGEVVTCWLDDEISDALLPGMTWVAINQAYPWFPKDLQATNGDYYFYVDSEY